MATEVLEELVHAGVHFGHQRRKWHPNMKPYILQEKNSIYLINLEETLRQIHEAAQFLESVARSGKRILFVGCKKQAQEAVRQAAEACNQFYINHRWLGGTLTNLRTVRQSISRLQYLEDIEKSPDYKSMSKKELAALGREKAKLQRNLDGIREMEENPGAIVIVDVKREHIAVAEAKRLNIPIVALVDTNSDPEPIDYPIAANDDAIKSIRIILQRLVDPVRGAVAERQKTQPKPSKNEELKQLIEKEVAAGAEIEAAATSAEKSAEPAAAEVTAEATEAAAEKKEESAS